MLGPKYYSGDEPMVYYTITLWEEDPAAYGETAPWIYDKQDTAEKIARHMVEAGFCHSVTVRKETVFLRDESHEVSSSDPVAEIKHNGEIWRKGA